MCILHNLIIGNLSQKTTQIVQVIYERTLSAQKRQTTKKSDLSAINYMEAKWKLDTRVILPRGPKDAFDSGVVGDPCIVWDAEENAWCMFYFAGGKDINLKGLSSTGMALSRSAEQIGPSDWRKVGPVAFSNPEALNDKSSWQKWFVVMVAGKNNQAAKINGKYWSMFVSKKEGHKVIQVASSTKLAGPWEVRKKAILTNDPEGYDGRSCDTPTAFWFESEKRVMIFYKAYPRVPQKDQPGSPFGSCTVLAYWNPGDSVAQKKLPLLQPGIDQTWIRGWVGGVQLLYNSVTDKWYGLMNGSPTPPEDKSNREPAPCIGGWIMCNSNDLSKGWKVDTTHSPLLYPENLTKAELDAGMGVNFWRHHLLTTPGGQARIFFNSGKYGTEQMYSWIME
jgi:hypothetical protein